MTTQELVMTQVNKYSNDTDYNYESVGEVSNDHFVNWVSVFILTLCLFSNIGPAVDGLDSILELTPTYYSCLSISLGFIVLGLSCLLIRIPKYENYTFAPLNHSKVAIYIAIFVTVTIIASFIVSSILTALTIGLFIVGRIAYKKIYN